PERNRHAGQRSNPRRQPSKKTTFTRTSGATRWADDEEPQARLQLADSVRSGDGHRLMSAFGFGAP
ncbi:hypothetical protein RBA06_20470, partial [Mycobacteroides abscessus subsp. abscessus]